VAFVEIGRISSKHVRVTVASPKGAQTPRGITAPPTQAATPLNNHVSAPMDESAKPVLADEEMPADHVEAMDTREGKSEWVCGRGDAKLCRNAGDLSLTVTQYARELGRLH